MHQRSLATKKKKLNCWSLRSSKEHSEQNRTRFWPSFTPGVKMSHIWSKFLSYLSNRCHSYAKHLIQPHTTGGSPLLTGLKRVKYEFGAESSRNLNQVLPQPFQSSSFPRQPRGRDQQLCSRTLQREDNNKFWIRVETLGKKIKTQGFSKFSALNKFQIYHQQEDWNTLKRTGKR